MRHNRIKTVDINLLECEVDIILDALMDKADSINKKYNYRKVSLTEEEATEKFVIRNTYEHILYYKASHNANMRKNKRNKKIA